MEDSARVEQADVEGAHPDDHDAHRHRGDQLVRDAVKPRRLGRDPEGEGARSQAHHRRDRQRVPEQRASDKRNAGRIRDLGLDKHRDDRRVLERAREHGRGEHEQSREEEVEVRLGVAPKPRGKKERHERLASPEGDLQGQQAKRGPGEPSAWGGVRCGARRGGGLARALGHHDGRDVARYADA